MNKLLVALSAAALMVSVGAANAEEAQGTITSIDEAKKTVTLQDGAVYELPASVDPATLKLGDAVMITFEKQDDKQIATAVTK